jgi:small subunit ribosomal protein S1
MSEIETPEIQIAAANSAIEAERAEAEVAVAAVIAPEAILAEPSATVSGEPQPHSIESTSETAPLNHAVEQAIVAAPGTESPQAAGTTGSPIVDAPLPETTGETVASEPVPAEPTESFGDIFSQYEKSQGRKPEDGNQQIEGTVVALAGESALFDIGFKTEGILPIAAFAGKGVAVGDKYEVSIKNRDAEGYYELSLLKVAQPKDWTLLEKAFAEKEPVLGTVSGMVKGGLTVDIGVRAFMPASRSGARDASDLAKLLGQQLRVRIIKLNVTEEDVVVDRRILAEEEERANKERLYAEVKEGDVVQGRVRSIAEYGAFLDLGGVDGLLHVSDLAWSRVANPADVLSLGQQIQVKVLKIDVAKQRISLGLKQLQPQPWDSVSEKYKVGDRVHGTVTRLADFGAFVELEPGIEGLVHISEMSWAKKVHKPGDIFKQGENIEAVILGIKLEERRISLGFKQLLTDPWAEAAQKFASGSIVEGPITSFTKFGAFVQVADGVEGMVHISEITTEKRINHPSEVLKIGEVVKAQILDIDKNKRQLKLSIKQLTPVSVDEYFAEHKAGDQVTGRVIDMAKGQARVELGEGIIAVCTVQKQGAPESSSTPDTKVDLSALSSMLKAKWKGGPAAPKAAPEQVRPGQIRAFRIAKIDPATKTVQIVLT